MTSNLRFLHIQKTGGSTLSSILRRIYYGRRKRTFFLQLKPQIEQLKGLPDDQEEKAFLFLGHAFFTTGIDIVDNAAKITLLREPISRVASLSQHIYEGKESYLKGDFPPETFSLDSLLRCGNLEFSNFQTRSLLGFEASSFEDMLAQKSTDEIVEQALDNLLNNVLSFGLTEYFDESLAMFSQALEWQVPPVYISKNTKNLKNILKFSPEQIQRVREMNQLDIELYRRAKKHFLARLQSPRFDSDRLARFQKVNRVYQSFVNKIPLPTQLPYPLNRISRVLR